jgi:hypothetical protein
MTREPTIFETVAVDIRVMGIWRAIKDYLYFRLAMLIPFNFQYRTGWLIGARGYFDWRDSNEFPVIGRFYSMRFKRWQTSAGVK